ncbi:MAG: hypothetical protein LUD22_03650, partial [Coprobacillus sp.]|nr:hypothetical protein [Coprobacillus sp.]
ETIYELAASLYDKNFKGMTIRLVGVTLSNLISKREAFIQMTFDNYELVEKESETRHLIDTFNKQFKKDLLMRASQVKKENH